MPRLSRTFLLVCALLGASTPARAGALSDVGNAISSWGDQTSANLRVGGHDALANGVSNVSHDIGGMLNKLDGSISGDATKHAADVAQNVAQHEGDITTNLQKQEQDAQAELQHKAQDLAGHNSPDAAKQLAQAQQDYQNKVQQAEQDAEKQLAQLGADAAKQLGSLPGADAALAAQQGPSSPGGPGSPTDPAANPSQPGKNPGPPPLQTREAVEQTVKRQAPASVASALQRATEKPEADDSVKAPQGRVSIPQSADPSVESRAAASARLAENEVAMRDYRRAITDAERAYREDPRSAAALLALSRAKAGAGDWPTATAAATLALKSDPQNLAARRLLALYYFQKGLYEQALKALKAVTESKDALALDYARLAAIRSALGGGSDAIAAADKAAELDKRYAAFAEQARKGGRLRFLASDDDVAADDPRRAPLAPRIGWTLLLALLGLGGAICAARRRAKAQACSSALLPASAMAVAQRFETTRLLRKSGSEETVEALDKRLERLVSITRVDCGGDKDRRARVASAARSLAAVRHPALLEIYEVADEDAGVSVIGAAWSGKTAAQLAAQAGRLPLAQAVAIVEEACAALEAAHAMAAAHGRVSTESLLVTDRGETRLVGFSLESDARSVSERRRDDVQGLAYCLYELAAGTKYDPGGAAKLPEDIPPALGVLVSDAAGPSPSVSTTGQLAARLKALLRQPAPASA